MSINSEKSTVTISVSPAVTLASLTSVSTGATRTASAMTFPSAASVNCTDSVPPVIACVVPRRSHSVPSLVCTSFGAVVWFTVCIHSAGGVTAPSYTAKGALVAAPG